MSRQKILITDGEGPLVFKDIARDVATTRIPDGQILFDTLSLYVAYAHESRGNYQPGETLAFLVPHLLAHGICNQDLRNESQSVQLANGVERYLDSLYSDGWQVRVISTAYQHLWEYVGPKIGIANDHIASTSLSLDELRELSWNDQMTEEVLKTEDKILKSKGDLADCHTRIRNGLNLGEAFARIALAEAQTALINLHRVTLPRLGFDPLEKTTVIGGERKTQALMAFAHDLGVGPNVVVYVGDSITDDKVHKFVKENGGLVIALNGDEYAIRNAVVAIATEDMQVLKPLLDSWIEAEHEGVQAYVLKNTEVPFGKERPFTQAKYSKHLAIVSENNVTELSAVHREFRVRIRGLSAPII